MIKFGTGGWREIIGDQFTKANVQKIAKALAVMIHEDEAKPEICVGYDRRFLSKEAAMWASEVLVSEGIHVYFTNKSKPTPLIMYTVDYLKLDYGMAITASHNPHLYNGIKVFTKGGKDADVSVTSRLQDLANQVEVVQPPYLFEQYVEQSRITYIDLFNEYIDSILDQIDQTAIRDARLKVVLDPMYGVSQTSLRTILSTVRCDLTVINERHDTLFGGKLPTPNSAALSKLKQTVLDLKCDFGIATDGDADRIGIIDDQGQFIHPNQILVLLYYYLLETKGWRGDVVRNNSTTHLLDKIAEEYGQKCHEVPVGFKHISSKMAETEAIIGGESSGGLTIVGHISGKDGIYAAALLVEMVAKMKRSISEILQVIEKRFGQFVYVDKDFHLYQEKKDNIYRILLENKELPEFPWPIDKVSYEDGCKIYFQSGGWLIVRFSGTEPIVRMAAEFESKELVDQAYTIIERFLQINPS